jgi:hypothetical protein
VAQGGRAAGLA